MKTRIGLWLGGWLCVLAAAGCSQTTAPGAMTQRVQIQGRTFHLELALDADARYQGLSDRASIAEDGGMLFVFPDSKFREFVMRRCLVPIDIIFLGANGRVVAMHAMQVEPPGTSEDELKEYFSEYPAQFAIELRGGTLPGLGLKKGQKIDLPLESLKARAQ